MRRQNKTTTYTALADKVAQLTQSKIFDENTPINDSFYAESEKMLTKAWRLIKTIELTLKINSHE